MKVVMLAPGGMYEGLICHPGMKRIPWERRTGFVKLAIETNTPIIPTFCQGLNDVYHNSKLLFKRIHHQVLDAMKELAK